MKQVNEARSLVGPLVALSAAAFLPAARLTHRAAKTSQRNWPTRWPT
jgi:hypothetical protein